MTGADRGGRVGMHTLLCARCLVVIHWDRCSILWGSQLRSRTPICRAEGYYQGNTVHCGSQTTDMKPEAKRIKWRQSRAMW